MALEYYTFVLGGAKGAIVQSTYSMLSPHSLNTVPLDSSQLTLKTLLFPQWLKKAVRSKKENVGFGTVSHCKPFRKQESERREEVTSERRGHHARPRLPGCRGVTVKHSVLRTLQLTSNGSCMQSRSFSFSKTLLAHVPAVAPLRGYLLVSRSVVKLDLISLEF